MFPPPSLLWLNACSFVGKAVEARAGPSGKTVSQKEVKGGICRSEAMGP